MRSLQPILIALSLVALSSPTSARNISWGSQPNDALFTSAGLALDASFVFEIGAFQGGFQPTVANMALWQTNWKVFDRAQTGDGWNAGAQWFAGLTNHQADGSSQSSPPLPAFSFAQDEQAYLWIYNSQSLAPTSEWALLTNDASDGSALDDWLFPDPADQFSVTAIDWKLEDATVAVVGGVNDAQTVGGGVFTANPGTFSLQTTNVPEPGSAILALIGGLWGVQRRRRRGPRQL